VSNRQKVSRVAVDAANIDTVRFWIDLAIANANGTREEFVRELEGQLAEQHQLVDPAIASLPAEAAPDAGRLQPPASAGSSGEGS
jgi:hypothetical protein